MKYDIMMGSGDMLTMVAENLTWAEVQQWILHCPPMQVEVVILPVE